MSGKSKKAGNLVALGSAAVVAVYGAGFMRTAAAAQRFAEQSDERVLSPEDAAAAKAEAAGAGAGNAAVTNDTNSAAPEARLVVASTSAKPAEPTAANKAEAVTAKADTKDVTSASNREVSMPMPPEVTTVASSSTGAASKAVAATKSDVVQSTPVNVPAPVAEKPVAVAAPVTTPAPTSAAPVTAPTTTATAAAANADNVAPPNANAITTIGDASAGGAKWRTGEFTGYGTSRHGDVEVYLETTDGKITYVKISQCLTQYSCSWISDLPRQVLARQSTRIDAVSGATQSANAFYYAVVQALAKAK